MGYLEVQQTAMHSLTPRSLRSSCRMVWSSFTKEWQKLKRGQPGSRFQERYERHRQAHRGQPWYRRLRKFAFAAIALAIGVVLVFIPGPAVVFFAVAAWLLADESRGLARALDWTEVTLRRMLNLGKTWWRRASLPARGAVMGGVVLGSGMAAYVVYRTLLGL